MDYSKQGGVKPGRNKPRHQEHNQRGTEKTPYGRSNPKAELLERMKKAAAKNARSV